MLLLAGLAVRLWVEPELGSSWRGEVARIEPGATFSIPRIALPLDPERLVNLTEDFSPELNPHGIGWWMAENGDLSLFVVNHRREGHFVEIFLLSLRLDPVWTFRVRTLLPMQSFPGVFLF